MWMRDYNPLIYRMFDFRIGVARQDLVRCTKKSLTWGKTVPTIGFVRCSKRGFGKVEATRKLPPRAVRSEIPGRSSTPDVQGASLRVLGLPGTVGNGRRSAIHFF
jgi:hypothetical protein